MKKITYILVLSIVLLFALTSVSNAAGSFSHFGVYHVGVYSREFYVDYNVHACQDTNLEIASYELLP